MCGRTKFNYRPLLPTRRWRASTRHPCGCWSSWRRCSGSAITAATRSSPLATSGRRRRWRRRCSRSMSRGKASSPRCTQTARRSASGAERNGLLLLGCNAVFRLKDGDHLPRQARDERKYERSKREERSDFLVLPRRHVIDFVYVSEFLDRHLSATMKAVSGRENSAVSGCDFWMPSLIKTR